MCLAANEPTVCLRLNQDASSAITAVLWCNGQMTDYYGTDSNSLFDKSKEYHLVDDTQWRRQDT